MRILLSARESRHKYTSVVLKRVFCEACSLGLSVISGVLGARLGCKEATVDGQLNAIDHGRLFTKKKDHRIHNVINLCANNSQLKVPLKHGADVPANRPSGILAFMGSPFAGSDHAGAWVSMVACDPCLPILPISVNTTVGLMQLVRI